MPKCDKYHAKWKANMAKCSKYHAKCKVTMPKCSKYHAKWQVLVPNCCKYKANGTRKESQEKIQKLRQKKQLPKNFYTLIVRRWVLFPGGACDRTLSWHRSTPEPASHRKTKRSQQLCAAASTVSCRTTDWERERDLYNDCVHMHDMWITWDLQYIAGFESEKPF